MSLELDDETRAELGLSRRDESAAEILYASYLNDLARLMEWRAENPELVKKQKQKYRNSDANREAQRRYYNSAKGKAVAARKAVKRKAKRRRLAELKALLERLGNAAEGPQLPATATNDTQGDSP